MSEKWIIIGISGVTCGGKTTLATELNKIISHSIVVSQDDYFFDVEDPRHTWIPELNHINFDILSSLDMEKMYADIRSTIKNKKMYHVERPLQKDIQRCLEINKNNICAELPLKIQKLNIKVLLIEGFCILNYAPIADLCDLKYYFTLDKEECYKRRCQRVYEPPDCPGYFEKCVWPEYLHLLEDVQTNVNNIICFNENSKSPLDEVLLDISQIL